MDERFSKHPASCACVAGLMTSALHSVTHPQCTTTACLMIPIPLGMRILVHTPIGISVIPDSTREISPKQSRRRVLEILTRISTTPFALQLREHANRWVEETPRVHRSVVIEPMEVMNTGDWMPVVDEITIRSCPHPHGCYLCLR